MIKVRRLEPGDPLYQQALALRDEEILRPIGLDMARFHQLFPGVEERLEHFVAIDESRGQSRVVGCASLLPNDPAPGAARMMQMAVSRQRQREGIGTMLVAAVERRALGDLGITEIACHAPIASLGFVRALGWEIDSDEFIEGGIPHRRMVMRHAGKPEAVAAEPEPEPDEYA